MAEKDPSAVQELIHFYKQVLNEPARVGAILNSAGDHYIVRIVMFAENEQNSVLFQICSTGSTESYDSAAQQLLHSYRNIGLAFQDLSFYNNGQKIPKVRCLCVTCTAGHRKSQCSARAAEVRPFGGTLLCAACLKYHPSNVAAILNQNDEEEDIG
jgi:hypothetical protein